MEGEQGGEDKGEVRREAEGFKVTGEERRAEMDRRGCEVFHTALGHCSNLRKSGCVLAWLVFQYGLEDPGVSPRMREVILGSFGAAMHRASRRRSRSLFPFPLGDLFEMEQVFGRKGLEEVVTEDVIAVWAEAAWLYVTLSFLNGLAGTNRALAVGNWSKSHRRAITSIEGSIKRVLQMECDCPRPVSEVQKELNNRFMSYTGEEVPKMQVLCHDQVLAALPPPEHGGSIDICKLVSDRTKAFLCNPDGCLLEDDGRELPPLQAKVHFGDGELQSVAGLLVTHHVCDWIPFEDVLEVRGQKVLNGLFAVGKGSFLNNGKEIQRCIMNLIPSNSVLEKLEGKVSKLPSITQWLGITLEDDEELQFFQSDMQSAFYLFKLPEKWRRMLAFNVVLDGSLVGLTPGKLYALACKVLPMGWSSAVGIMQEVADRLTVLGGLPEEMKIERDKAIPPWMTEVVLSGNQQDRAWFHVYLDNFCAAEKVKMGVRASAGVQLHERMEEAWDEYGVLSSKKKRVSESPAVVELGAAVRGDVQLLGPSGERLIKLLQSTLFVIGDASLKRKWVQVIAGRWVHVLQFRRPGMASLDSTWKFINNTGNPSRVAVSTRGELFGCCLGLCLFNTFLGAKVSGICSASDASGVGGAVGVASQLTPEGASFVQTEQSTLGTPECHFSME